MIDLTGNSTIPQSEQLAAEFSKMAREAHWKKRAGTYIEFWKSFIERNKEMETFHDLKWFQICQEIELINIEFPVLKNTLNIEIDVRRLTLEDIDNYLETVIRPIREEAHRQREALIRTMGLAAPFVAFDTLTDSSGRKRDWKEVFIIWRNCLKIYDLFQEQARKGKTNMAEIARQIDWFPDEPDADNRCYPSRKVRKYLNLAERLINAAGNGTFPDESIKPLP